jgi:hypothetical protein
VTTPNPRDIRWIPGRFSVNPSDLTIAYPHGGTALGEKRAATVEPNQDYEVVLAEEFGGEVVEAIDAAGEGWAIAAIMRGYDDDVISRFFPNTAVGTVTQRRLITAPGTVRAGRLMSASSVVLVFTPDALDDQPMFVFHRAIPMLKSTGMMRLADPDPFEIGVAFQAIRNTSGRAVSIGWRHDITL